jgi:hypothetical protein
MPILPLIEDFTKTMDYTQSFQFLNHREKQRKAEG